MKKITLCLLAIWAILTLTCCKNAVDKYSAEDIKKNTQWAWKAYRQYAWGHDALLPISKGYSDWYTESLNISPIDAYSTLFLMDLTDETTLIENYIADSISFDKDLFVKTFEVNIRILGGLLTMFQSTGNPKILQKAEDFGKRLLPAFESKTGIPYYWVNLKTGEVKGDTVNAAEGGTYLIEMGMLSRFTKNPVYYQKAKNATMALFEHRSKIDLIGQDINVETGEWTNKVSHIGACIDSYYEYMVKGWILFGDQDLKKTWDISIEAINKYLAEERDSLLWYGVVDMNSGQIVKRRVTLYDAFFPALLALSGDIERAEKLQTTWDWLWNKYGLEPMAYDYEQHKPTYPVYDLNPEIIESSYYLYHFTGNQKYRDMAIKYFKDICKYCKTDVAFTAVENVVTKEKRDYLATYFFAETMKYFYLIFSDQQRFDFDSYIFSTEAHPFKK